MKVRLFYGERADIWTTLVDREINPPRLLPMFVIAAVILGYLSPVPGLDEAEYPTRIAFWTIALVLFVVHYFTAEMTIVHLGRRFGGTWVPEPLITLAALAVTTVVLLHLSRQMPIPYITTGEVLQLSAANFLWLQLAIHIYTVFIGQTKSSLRPRPRPSMPVPHSPEAIGPGPPPAWKIVDLAGFPFLEADVLTMQAQDHYVEVRTPHRTHVIRGSLKTMIGSMSPDSGMQVSRSAWISRRCKVTVCRNRGSMWLLLDGDLRLDVSRGRQAKVLEWLDAAPSPDEDGEN